MQRTHKNRIDFDSNNFYENFVALHPNTKINQAMHTKVIKTFMKIAVKKMLYEMYRLNFPGLGLFYIIKYKYTVKKEGDKIKVTAPTNWVETNKLIKQTGDKTRKVYFLNEHTNGYTYKIKWYKNHLPFINRQFYSFVPARDIQRWLAKEIKNNVKPFNAYAS